MTGQRILSFVLIAMVSACGKLPPLSPADIESHYKVLQTPPLGYARVYVLPPLDRTSLGEYEPEGLLRAGQTSDHLVLVGWVTKQRFSAFDTLAGVLFLKWGNGSNYKDQAQYFNVANGQTLAVRPYAAQSGRGFGLVGAVVAAIANEGKPSFELVDINTLQDLLKSKHLSSVPPEASSLFQQK